MKIKSMGKRHNLFIVSGTEMVLGGPTSITNSQRAAFSQFKKRELFHRNLSNMLGFPLPLMCPVSHRNRDTDEELIASLMRTWKL